jgi:flagellar protein FliS
MNSYAQSADAYLVQRVMGASPEQQAALLMEAAQRFIGKAIQAIEQKDYPAMARCFTRVTEIITESALRLNYEEGGELVQNLANMYDWWTREIFKASATRDVVQLRIISDQMGEIRQAWEQFHGKKVQMNQPMESRASDQIV